MDRSLREMGSTDTGTGKRVQKMARAFYGRLQAYESSLMNPAAFHESLRRNCYREQDVPQEQVAKLARYVAHAIAHLQQIPSGELTGGAISFPKDFPA
jgi:cytochrome b pre-mRNA-processing protein 3